ncbi:trehalose 6-phosphate phosphatase [Phaffia rhodozyma]|uniref:Trehalose 6-phosphate phosphatase n=1 Tax=Phaffia rhodozyma TaxID=264483 RepID=A0A0F7SS07_PHARH|nr:trehalose 6-phosphate phosphatase [Phaffia rhodozyma]
MEPSLSSIQEPPQGPNVSLEDMRARVKSLEDDLKSKEFSLSGRLIHVCHYLPVVPVLSATAEPEPKEETPAPVLTAPATPAVEVPATSILEDLAKATNSLAAQASSTAASVASKLTASDASSSALSWTVTPRRGHTAMNSGIQSLSETHKQVVVGWTGTLESQSNSTEGESHVEQETSETDKLALEEKLKGEPGAQLVPVWLPPVVAKEHYEGYCKSTLWPLFHYLLWQDVASEYPREDPSFASYYKANMAFAEKVASIHKPGDLIIVHDYHLLLAPKMIRELLPEANIALFIHAPFPSSEIFRSLPKRKEILEGMLGANLVSFQTYSYSRHFISTCIRVCGFETTPAGVDHNGSVTAVSNCAIGIDCERVTADRNRPEVAPKVEALRSLYSGKKIIVGREKLDVSKGVIEKLQAFEKLLECYPEWRGKVVLIQVTQPSLTESRKLERQLSELVSHINGLYGSLDFTPVHHYHQTIERDEYFALLSVADLQLITALRDGMNTTSMEYAICQDKTNKSPLVISEFMGTASSFNSALLVNPHDVLGVARAINQGLVMSEEEKVERHNQLYEQVVTHTSAHWAATLVTQLLSNIGGDNTAHQTPYLEKVDMKAKYDNAKKRLLLFDYDGTLTPIVKVPSQATPTEKTLKVIKELSNDPRNVVYLISGRDGDFLEEHWGHVGLLGLSAEHGCFVRPPGSTEWKGLTDALDMSWMSEVNEIFKYYTERTTGSFIEKKKASITWHYRSSDPDFGSFQCKQCHDLLESSLATRRPIEVLVGKKNLEVRPLAINKGEIVKQIVYNHPDAEFIFCAGDDKTDEDMFRSLRTIASSSSTMAPPIAVTSACTAEEAAKFPDVETHIQPEGIFSTAVGPSAKKTLARWHVTSPEEVVDMMDFLIN